MSEPENVEYGLVIPFIVCASEGGPYDDESFTAGVRYGVWDMLLKLKPSQHEEYEYPGLIPQLDLLAMHHGYSIKTEPYESDPTWVLVTMRRGLGHFDE